MQTRLEKRIIIQFLEAGLQLEPRAYDILRKVNEPQAVVERIISQLRHVGSKVAVVTAEMVMEEIAPTATATETTDTGLGKYMEQRVVPATEDWDFANADTQRYSHGLHPYPARMIPQIANRLIARYSPPGATVLDPFCGSGTVLTESRLMRSNNQHSSEPRHSVGVDINPLAVLLAKVKSTPIEPPRLEQTVGEFLRLIDQEIYRVQKGKRDLSIPSEEEFPNLSHWFKDYVIRELAVIRHGLKDIRSSDVRDFLKVCFSLTVRKVSNIYNSGDTFTKRFSAEQLKIHRPNVPKTFRDTVIQGLTKIKEFSRSCDMNASSEVMLGDTRSIPLSNKSVDTIITSPPYGEERSTVSYTRWSKLSSYWLGFSPDIVRRLEKASLGAESDKSLDTPSGTFNEVLSHVSRNNPDLARSAASFVRDYSACLREMNRVLRSSGYCCVVIGNRSLLRRRVPMDIVSAELGKSAGFLVEKIYHRTIPTKAIPWTVAKGETIGDENIVIFKKS